jgi:RHS repeat-associated protein
MTTRGSQTLTWDYDNRQVSITDGENTSTFVYDGNGNRAKKTEGGETILYVNMYYEKNLTTSEVTTSYYLGGRLIAQRKGTTLSYIHQDHLSGTAFTSDSGGAQTSAIKFYPFGATRSVSGIVPTDKKFTGQRLDETGLYYYEARYYDANIGRFISADSIVPDPANPQCFNRYSYCLNNPLKYTDPTGHGFWGDLWNAVVDVATTVVNTVVSTAQTVATTVASTAQTVATTVANTLSGGWDTFVNGAQGVGETVGNAVTNAAAQIGGWWDAGWQAAAGWVSQTVGIQNVTSTQTNVNGTPMSIPTINVTPGGWVDKVVLQSGIVDATAMSVPNIGIFTTMTDPTILKHESFHYWEQSKQGALSWTVGYFTEIGIRRNIYKSLNVDNALYNAYYYSSYERRAWDYAGVDIGEAPGPSWLEALLGD